MTWPPFWKFIPTPSGSISNKITSVLAWQFAVTINHFWQVMFTIKPCYTKQRAVYINTHVSTLRNICTVSTNLNGTDNNGTHTEKPQYGKRLKCLNENCVVCCITVKTSHVVQISLVPITWQQEYTKAWFGNGKLSLAQNSPFPQILPTIECWYDTYYLTRQTYFTDNRICHAHRFLLLCYFFSCWFCIR